MAFQFSILEYFKGSKYARIVLPLVLVCAIAATAFAHHTYTISYADEMVDLSEYVLPDGSVPEICIGGENHPHMVHNHCPLCTLTSQAALPNAPDISISAYSTNISYIPLQQTQRPEPKKTNQLGARAPPQSIWINKAQLD